MPFLPPQQYPDPRVAREVEDLHARYLRNNRHDVRVAIESLQVRSAAPERSRLRIHAISLAQRLAADL